MNSNTAADTEAGRGTITTQADALSKPSSSTSSFGWGFRSVVPPTTARPKKWTKLSASYIVKDAFRLHTLLAIGAGLQAVLSAAAPKPWCFLPVAIVLGLAPTTTLVQMALALVSIRGRRRVHSFLADAVLGRSTAYLSASRQSLPGQEGNCDSDRNGGLVAFHFGARFNHPLGVFAPGARAMTRLFRATLAALDEDRAVYGLLGGDLFRGGASTRASNDTILLVLYFRSVEGLQQFAGSKAHREAFRWLREVTAPGENGEQRYPHLSAFHETFVVPAGGYETLYINTAPILLGNTFAESMDGHGDGHGRGHEQEQRPVWVSPLVDADDARLRTMAARLKHGR
ncbi:hypothetical protein SCUCBS95973_000680 [Sporothrix curviconia]|uniref:Monooxygenase n=1 Tax=Sporothrix curviconia TaxID=1260050 RepID=A0ABP0AS52_9PEZI